MAGSVVAATISLDSGQVLGNVFAPFGYTVATLPTSPPTGSRAYVTDALTSVPTFMSVVVGASIYTNPVFYDGVQWRTG